MTRKAPSSLYAKLDSLKNGDTIEVNIFLKNQPALEPVASENLVAEDPQPLDAVGSMRSEATASQRELLSYLQGDQIPFMSLNENVSLPKVIVKDTYWINNSVTAEVTREVLETILEREDVEFVELRSTVSLEDMLDAEIVCDPPEKDAASTVAAAPALNADSNNSAGLQPEIEATVLTGAAEPTSTIKRIGAPQLWANGLTGDGIIVAVIDSGVNYDHPDLKSHMWDGGEEFPHHGFDFLGNDNDPRDDPKFNGHGTACAGIVAGDGTSGEATGVAPKAIIMAIRARDENSLWAGFQLALQHGAHVISMSLSIKHLPLNFESPTPIPTNFEPNSLAWRRVCENVLAAGVLHANSVGNNGDAPVSLGVPRNIGAPANCPPPKLHRLQILKGGVSSVISCGATTQTDTLDAMSSRGPVAWDSTPFSDYPFDSNGQQGLIKPDICAPGLGSRSCNSLFDGSNGEKPYKDFRDTSAAAAHVGGCLALLAEACKRSKKPIVLARIQEALENTAKRIVGQTQRKENTFGAGRIDVYEAYLYGKDPKRQWWD